MEKKMLTWSFWEQASFLQEMEICVLGGGIVGLNAALTLKQLRPTWKIAVIDRGVLPLGASTRNAGFACFGSISELLSDLDTMPENEVFELVKMRYEGLKVLKEMVGEKNMHYVKCGGFEVFRKEDLPLYEQCMAHLAYFNGMMFSITKENVVFTTTPYQEILNLGLIGVKNLIVNRLEGQIHTGEMMRTLLEKAKQAGIIFLNGLNITKIAEDANAVHLLADNGLAIKTNKVLVCTNGFTKHFYPELDVQPARNQVLVTSPIENLKLKGTFHYQEGYYYFRNIGENRVLIGGGRHLDKVGETTSEFGETEHIQTALRNLLSEMILPYHSYQIEYQWSGIMGIGAIKHPIIERKSDKIGLAVRMGGMGVAIGSLVGKKGAEMMLE